MLILYLFLLLTLLLARLVIAGRARMLERKFTRVARDVRELHNMPVHRQGNNNKPDALVHAKQQYLLGNLVQKRDQVEGLLPGPRAAEQATAPDPEADAGEAEGREIDRAEDPPAERAHPRGERHGPPDDFARRDRRAHGLRPHQ